MPIADTNANNVRVVTNGYNANGWLTARWTAAKGLAAFGYDLNGNPTNAAYPSMTNSFGFDELNRLKTLTDATGTSAFTYASFGAFNGALASEDGPWASDTITNYYANQRRTGMMLAQPSGAWTESFSYDGLSRLSTLIAPEGQYAYSYSAAGNLVRRIGLPYGLSITNYFDGLGQLKGTWFKNGAGNDLNSHAYAYDLNGYRTNTYRLYRGQPIAGYWPASFMAPKTASWSSRPCDLGRCVFSCIHPSAPTHGPPTSSAVLVNLRPAPLITAGALLTE